MILERRLGFTRRDLEVAVDLRPSLDAENARALRDLIVLPLGRFGEFASVWPGRSQGRRKSKQFRIELR